MKLPDNIQKARPRVKADVQLDANESPFNAPDNRYPDEELLQLKTLWGRHERIPAQCIYMCNGTEEAVDLAMRAFALPCRDSVASAGPTRSIYRRRAAVNRLEYREAALRREDFSLNTDVLLNVISQTTKMIFLCSPNSPTGNVINREMLSMLLERFDGMVVVDESYVDFVSQATMLSLLNTYKNLVILRSFSHAWSAAGLRLAAIVAHPSVIKSFERVGYTHPLSSPVVREATKLVCRRLDVDKWARLLNVEREKVRIALKELPECLEIYPSYANFIFVRFVDSVAVYKYLLGRGVAVKAIQGCLRLTIGLPGDNSALIGALRRRKAEE